MRPACFFRKYFEILIKLVLDIGGRMVFLFPFVAEFLNDVQSVFKQFNPGHCFSLYTLYT